MRMNQNETLRTRKVSASNSPWRAKCGKQTSSRVATQHTAAFTLTELLVVITIIGILASLITGAAMNALRKAKETAISVEIQQLASAIEDFKNQHGSYPPNVYSEDVISGPEINQNQANVVRFLKRVAPRGTGPANVANIAVKGLSPAEAIVFWLSGFSADVQRPLSGTDLTATSIDDNGAPVNNVITIDTFQNPLYDFDRTRLRISRDSNGMRRFIEVERAGGAIVQIQLYEYLAEGSQEPFVYFDTSRESPLEAVRNWDTTEFFYTSRNSPTDGKVYPLKQLRPDAPSFNTATPPLEFIEYLEKGRFQIVHCGIDDLWGDYSQSSGSRAELDLSASNPNPTEESGVQLLFPVGPFLGDLSDNVGNFSTSNLADAQE